jgi:hypothetical protein
LVAEGNRWRFLAVATKGAPAGEYRTALEANPEALNFLLLDSDEPLKNGPRTNLLRRKRLEGCDSESIFWMVQVMESWFLADTDALRLHYGDGFREKVLQGNPKVQEISKADVLSKLNRATKATKRGAYEKNHAFVLLGLIDPDKVRKAAPECQRMFDTILAKLN